MGVPPGSMTLTSLCDGIPPVYARFIAKAFIGQAETQALEKELAQVHLDMAE